MTCCGRCKICRKEWDVIEQQRDDAIDLLIDCAGQFLFEENGIVTHSFMSTEERLCDFLVKIGRMEQIGRAKFKFISTKEKKVHPIFQDILAAIHPPNVRDHRAGPGDQGKADQTIAAGSGASTCWAGPGQEVQP